MQSLSLRHRRETLTTRQANSSFVALAVLLAVVLTLLPLREGVVKATDTGPDRIPDAGQTTFGALVISEFRLRGPNGATDEFIEIYNNFGSAHTVDSISGTGYGIAASDGITRCTIPNNTVIPAGGHYLCTNSTGYSLTNYPAGNGTLTNGNSTYITDIPDNFGIALFNNNTGGASYTFANRFDAVGANTEPNNLYRENAGYGALPATNMEGSLIRRYDPADGRPTDTDVNANDFVFTDTVATPTAAGQQLGVPGPQNLSSPIFTNFNTVAVLPVDATKASSMPPNRLRDTTSDPGNNSLLGTLSIRRRIVNNTGGNVTRVRFRIADISTFPAPAGTADLRLRSASAVVLGGIADNATCAAAGAATPCTITAQGITLETPPAQPNGGAFNSSGTAGTVTLGTPLPIGASLNLQFLFGVQQNGNYRITFELELLPSGGTIFQVRGNTTLSSTTSDAVNTVADFDGDGRSDISVFRPSAGAWYLLRSTAGFTGVSFGLSSDKIVPADFDGDGKTDIAVYRPATGFWFIINSSTNTLKSTQFGAASDLPAPADYDGDGKADLTVFRPPSGVWFRLNSGNGSLFQTQFGANGDTPQIGDYDGDGKSDLAVYRPSAGTWYRINSGNGSFTGAQFGTATDLTTPGDYDGDGKTDLAVFRPSVATWFRLNSGNGAFVATVFGANGDNPAPGDFDSDGKEDISVFRAADGTWYRLNSSNGAFFAQQFGVNGDLPTPSAFRY